MSRQKSLVESQMFSVKLPRTIYDLMGQEQRQLADNAKYVSLTDIVVDSLRRRYALDQVTK